MVSAALQSHSSALSYAVKQLIAQELATAAMRRNSDEYGREIKGLAHEGNRVSVGNARQHLRRFA